MGIELTKENALFTKEFFINNYKSNNPEVQADHLQNQ